MFPFFKKQISKSLSSTMMSLPVTTSLTFPAAKHLENYETTLTFPNPHLLPLLLSSCCNLLPFHYILPTLHLPRRFRLPNPMSGFWPLTFLPSPKRFTFFFFKLRPSLNSVFLWLLLNSTLLWFYDDSFTVFHKYIFLYSLLKFLGFLIFFPSTYYHLLIDWVNLFIFQLLLCT